MRTTREFLENQSDIFHVILRGNGKQILFEKTRDAKTFLTLMRTYAEKHEQDILCYCLMENHVHVLLRDPTHSMRRFMQTLCATYAQIYNENYDHVGHVFQGRYISEPVRGEKYFITVFRYILKNPEKAGIKPYDQYPWNSYRAFKEDLPYPNSKFVRGVFDSINIDPMAFLNAPYSSKEEIHDVAEYDRGKKSDTWAKLIMQETFHITSGTELKQLPKEQRNAALQKLLDLGLSHAQIERLTGINRNWDRKRTL